MASRKDYFDVSIIICVLLFIVFIAYRTFEFLEKNEDSLFSFFEKKELFISETDIQNSDSIVDGNSVGKFFVLGMNDEYPVGEWVVITGDVLECGESIGRRPYIGLGVGNYHGVGCFFDKQYSYYILNRINKGQELRIRGQFKGKMYGNLILANCAIIK